MTKPTYSMIAEAAGVGTATVERVLNGRGGVRPQTAQRVILAARSLDWPGRLPEQHRGILRIEVILVRPGTSFFERLAHAFRRIAASLDATVQVHVTFVDSNDHLAIAERIARPQYRRAGLVISASDHPAVRRALRKAHASGLPIVQVVSQTDEGPTFVGIDNYAAGRTAAMMVSRLNQRPGTVIALAKGGAFQDFRERIRGFSDYMAEHGPADRPFPYVAISRDDRDEAARAIVDAARRWPDLSAVYNASGGNSGAFKALEKLGKRVFFVGHELNDLSAEALRNGTADVIFDQLPEAQARRAIDVLLSRIGLIDVEIDNPPVRFTTITTENV